MNMSHSLSFCCVSLRHSECFFVLYRSRWPADRQVTLTSTRYHFTDRDWKAGLANRGMEGTGHLSAQDIKKFSPVDCVKPRSCFHHRMKRLERRDKPSVSHSFLMPHSFKAKEVSNEHGKNKQRERKAFFVFLRN